MRLLAQLLLALLTVLSAGAAMSSAPTAQAQPAGGSIRIALLDIPADRADDPRAQTYIVDNIPPGVSITRRVEVSNNTGAPAVLDIYAGPAAIEDGAFVPRPRGESNPLSTWVSLSASEVALEDGQSAEVEVTIAVPADAPEVEQYGAVWASTRPADLGDGQQISQVSRVGVRLYVSVGEGNGPPSDFSIRELSARRAADGTASVVTRVENVGGRAVDVSGSLALTDGPGGLTAQAVTASMVTIAPGGEAEVEFVIPSSAALPAGPWRATVDLASGWTEHSISESVTFPDAGAEPEAGGFPVAAGAGIAAVALGLLILTTLLARRRGSRGTGEEL